jgi:hypothetical protein
MPKFDCINEEDEFANHALQPIEDEFYYNSIDGGDDDEFDLKKREKPVDVHTKIYSKQNKKL